MLMVLSMARPRLRVRLNCSMPWGCATGSSEEGCTKIGNIQVGHQPVERMVALVVQQGAANVRVDADAAEAELQHRALQLSPASGLQRRHMRQRDDAAGEPLGDLGHLVVDEARRGDVDPVPASSRHGARPDGLPPGPSPPSGRPCPAVMAGGPKSCTSFPSDGEPVGLPHHGLAVADQGVRVPVVFLGHPVMVRVDDEWSWPWLLQVFKRTSVGP